MSNYKEYIGENGDKITLDYNTYLEIVKGCILEYGDLTKEQVSEIITNSDFLNDENFPPKSYNQIALLDNETIYDISMKLLYGDSFWNHPSYKSIPLDEYNEWENKFIREHNLNEDYIAYD